MKQLGFILWLLAASPAAGLAQEKITLEQAYQLAEKNYPVIRQKDLMRKTADINIENLGKGYLPQLNISGQATYQSDVTQVKIPNAGVTISPPSQDQYKFLADVSQVVYDGGAIGSQKEVQQLNVEVENQKVEVDLQKLRERINQVYLSVLYIDAQVAQVDLVEADINIGIKRVEAQVNNGIAFRSNLDVLKAELLKNKQRRIELAASRKGLVDVLSVFINQPLPANVELETPSAETTLSPEIHRPELNLFEAQTKLAEGQLKLINAKVKPKASLFFQGGYGKPGLNLLENQFAFFYTTGVRFNWSLGNWYTHKNEKKLVDVNRQLVDVQKETFLLNTRASLQQQAADIDKWQQLINTDEEIIDLRLSVKNSARAQLENGVITANDYLREVNAEDQARQSLIAHQLQLLQSRINYKTITGNQ